ncbi:aspartyl-phosphate phosphatase Spo0E family protein [Clostridium thailandense]|uniref:Aspartyl-phosphate phosphatase Spo0E family protein n=1 Tax=Clostridium thailandense TaxID=2794346 RepID=A0A949X405_9CLOT|nr:aspartyl-phosphate phosphatase Spo0E family protein [Clostridium thailandense]MBV7275599.1 aspartyl-phosphate phosphatase Spo0E family protein [Clostridium thailandense]
MNKIEELLIKIDELRKIMCNLIDEQSNLLDPKVVQASQNLDEALNFYHELLKSKERK